MITENDFRSRRCPMLGHDVDFSYCRAPGNKTPCRKIFDCWWETFDVHTFINNNYDKEVIETITSPPKPKVLSLLEIIQQAKQNAQHNKK